MTTGLDVFDTSVEKTNKILNDIEKELGWENRRQQTYLALRSVLHTLRDRLPVNEAVNFSAQLPLLLKGVFFDGWKSESVPIRMNKEEFLNHVRSGFQFSVEDGIEKVVKVVLDKVFSTVDPGETEKIIMSLPPDISELFFG